LRKTKEEEVRAAYKSLKEAEKAGKKVPIGPLAGQSIQLCRTDYADCFYYSNYLPSKIVNFYSLWDTSSSGGRNQKPGGEAEHLLCNVHIDSGANSAFGPFCTPKQVSRKSVEVKSCCDTGKYKLSFKFLGGDYLKLRVPREMAAGGRAPRGDAPEMFEFVGVRRDLEKERAECKERFAKLCPSLRESWFEINHPMGSWYD
jgi:hypothetical protein